MFTLRKKDPVQKIKRLLDLAFYGGGAITLVFVALSICFGGTFHYGPRWPVKLKFDGFTQLPLTRVNVHQSAQSQTFIEAQPSSIFLTVVRESSDFPMLGFHLAWLLLTVGTFFMIVYLLRKIFIPMDAKNPFDQKTPGRLRLLGWIIIITSLLRSLVTFLYGLYVSSLLNSLPESMKATVPDPLGRPIGMFTEPIIDLAPGTLFLGLVMFALAIAFQHGLDLQRDQSLTV